MGHPIVDTVLFDFDGTLVETALDFAAMRRRVLALAAKCGITPPEDLYILEMIAQAQRHLMARQPGIAQPFVRKAERILVDIEVQGVARAQPLFGVQETLTRLQEQGMKIGIVTRNCRLAVEQILARHALPHDLLLTRDDVVRVKPDPGHLLEALRMLESEPGQALMVGDHPMDILAGQRAGTRTAAITTTRTASGFAEVHPDWVIDQIPELLGILPKAVTGRAP